MTAPRVPLRLSVAVDALDVRPGQRILEIGGGRGIAAWLVCARLGDGRLVGIDRSATAVAASARLNQEAVERGVAEFRQLAIESVDPTLLGTFDTVFCVNVNAFWTRPAQRELGVVGGMLRPGGLFHLMYTPRAGSDFDKIRGPVLRQLGEAGLGAELRVRPAGIDQVVDFVATAGSQL